LIGIPGVLIGLVVCMCMCLEGVGCSSLVLLLFMALEILWRFYCHLSSFYLSHRRCSSFLTDSSDSSALIFSIRVCAYFATGNLSLSAAIKVWVSLSLMCYIDRGIVLCNSLYRAL
jgi:hypothetical protein